MVRWTIVFTILIVGTICEDEPQGIEEQDGDAEDLYNKTYIEHQTLLEKALFKGYNRQLRPVKNTTKRVEVKVHYHAIHISINQDEQTMQLYGHLYMTWDDEMLGWDPDKYNGLRITRAKRWQIWNPQIRVSNSVSGVASHHEISKTAHVLLNSKGTDHSQVEVYPTMSIKVGCNMDFSDYPYDENTCTVRIFTAERMSEVDLQFYSQLPPTVLLGWGNQSTKRIISDFEILNATNQMTYYLGGNYSSNRPVTAEDMQRTWSTLLTTFRFRRHYPMFSVGFALPCLVSALFSTLPFFIPNLVHALYALICNVFLQSIFLQELISEMPRTTSRLPKCVVFYSFTLIWNLVSALFHFWALHQSHTLSSPPPIVGYLYKLKPKCVNKGERTDIDTDTTTWSHSLIYIRTIGGIFNLLLYTMMAIYFLWM